MAARLFILVLWLVAVWGSTATAQAPSPYQVKAAFLYNFLKFVEWPPDRFSSPSSPYVVGVLGSDPFGELLNATMRGKRVNGRPVTITRASEGDMARCHLLFLCSSEQRRFPEIFRQLQSHSVLTVGEANQFATNGGMIGFYITQNKVRFQINPAVARRADLHMHPTLLSLAQIVE